MRTVKSLYLKIKRKKKKKRTLNAFPHLWPHHFVDEEVLSFEDKGVIDTHLIPKTKVKG